MDVIEELCGQWRLTAGGVVDPVPPEALDEETPGLEVREDGRTSDHGRLVRLGALGSAGLGLIEVDLGGDSILSGAWRASPAGAFLADTGGGTGSDIGEFLRPRPWLHDAARVSVEHDELTLWSLAGEPTARLQRSGGWALRRASRNGPARATSLPVGLVAVAREELLGAWEPLIAPTGRWSGWRWQNLEFTDDGWWHAFPRVNIGSGRWRHDPDSTLLAFNGAGKTLRMVTGWLDLDTWLFPVARAGFDAEGQLVLLDDTNHELQRLRPTDSSSWPGDQT